MASLISVLASITQPVPESGTSGLLLGLALLSLGFVARAVKNRKR
jgi:hypothetical protein